MVSLLLSLLSNDAFIPKNNTVYNGFDLFTDNGFETIEVKMGKYL